MSFRDKRTREFAEGNRVKAFFGFDGKAEMKLDELESATSLLYLDLPGNRLEALRGDRKGQYSIRINDNGGYASSGRKVRRGRYMLK